MPKGKVLVVDSDERVRLLLSKSLRARGYAVLVASSAEECLKTAFTEKPDLIILAANLPGMDAVQACQEIRSSLFVPIIFLGEHAEETELVLGLGVGADYYIAKPFKFPVMLAHVDAALRREIIYSGRRSHPPTLKIKDLTLDLSAHELRRNGDVIPLSPTEFRLIHALAQNAGRVLSRSQLLDFVWQIAADGVYSRTVDVHIGRIRRKIGDDPSSPQYILTVAGLGYKAPLSES